MTAKQEWDMFLELLVRKFPDRTPSAVLELARRLQREAKAMNTWAERVCSVEMPEEELNRGFARDEARERRVAALCAAWGITPVFNGDPRGAMICLFLPGTTPEMGSGSSLCVPEGN